MLRELSRTNIDIAVVIVSCDKYKDLWHSTLNRINSLSVFDGVDKYLTVNFEELKIKGWNIIKCGEDISWSDNLIYALEAIKNEFIFLLVEDIYIEEVIDNDFLFKSINYLKDMDSYYIKLIDFPETLKINDHIGNYCKGEPFSISVNGIWKVRELKKILARGESAWDFEINGSFRAKNLNTTLAFKRGPLKMLNLVEKGKWSEDLSVGALIKLGLNPKSREYMKTNDKIKSRIKKYFFNWMVRNNWECRIRLSNAIKKILASY